MANTYEIVTARLIAQLESGIIPWKQPWKNSSRGSHLPCNFATRRSYRGINCVMLMTSAYPTPEWMTYKQAQDMGAQVRKGETGAPVVYWRFDEDADTKKKSAWCRYSTVFNIAQMDGIQPEIPFDLPPFDGIAIAQHLADGYVASCNAPRVLHGGSNACYAPDSDTVFMPAPQSFITPETYYSTLFHEFAHSTGSVKRLARDLGGKFGTPSYSKEELVAEFTAAFLNAESGIASDDLEAHNAAYIQSWIRTLKADSRIAVYAAQRAQKAADFIAQRVTNADAQSEVTA